MVNTDAVPSKLSELISQKMAERGMSIRDLSEKIDIVYEHTRRIVRGDALPSKAVLKLICEELKLPYKTTLDVANEAKMREKFGDLALTLAGRKPSLEPLERVWDNLSESQQQDIISMAQGWAKRTRASKA